MRRVLDLRITRWELKLVYVLAAYVMTLVPVWIAPPLEPFTFIARLASTVLLLGAYLLGARIFRGKGEPVSPPRPWWRMTARAKLSRRLGILFTVGVAFLVIGAVLEAGGVARASLGGTPYSILLIVENGVLACLYLNSGIRLRRRGEGTPAAPLTPTFKPKRLPIR